MSLYRSRAIEAVQWSGSNWHEVYAMTGHDAFVIDGQLKVKVVESVLLAPPGSWVLKIDGQLSVMADEQFVATFEEVES